MLFTYLYFHYAGNAPDSRSCTGTIYSTNMTFDIIHFLWGEYVMLRKVDDEDVHLIFVSQTGSLDDLNYLIHNCLSRTDFLSVHCKLSQVLLPLLN
jgi:hypothetical protein